MFVEGKDNNTYLMLRFRTVIGSIVTINSWSIFRACRENPAENLCCKDVKTKSVMLSSRGSVIRGVETGVVRSV